MLLVLLLTCKEGHEQCDPAEDVRPGEAPVSETPPEEVHRHTGVDRHGEQNEKSCRDIGA